MLGCEKTTNRYCTPVDPLQEPGLHAGLLPVPGPLSTSSDARKLILAVLLLTPCRSLDYTLGYCLFLGLFLLSFLGFVSRIQAALLFNTKFAKSLKRGRLLVLPPALNPWTRSAAEPRVCLLRLQLHRCPQARLADACTPVDQQHDMRIACTAEVDTESNRS